MSLARKCSAELYACLRPLNLLCPFLSASLVEKRKRYNDKKADTCTKLFAALKKKA